MRPSPQEIRQIAAASRALARLPARAPTSSVFEAIRPCAPVAAGLFSVIRPDSPDALITHAFGLPPEVLEGWLATSREQSARALAPMISSRPGRLWRDSETITGAQREQMDVLRLLDAANLGEGAGYKVLKRWSPAHGAEHFMLALIMPRGESISPRSQAMLAALNPAIRDAVLRLGLPIVAREPILAQLVEEQRLGYVCLSTRGQVLEANRRAHHLVTRYARPAGIEGRRRAVTEFAQRARENTGRGRAWYLRAARPASMLLVHAHRLAKETHALAEDILLVTLNEVLEPPFSPSEPPSLAALTPREREVALALVRGGESYKEIADALGVRPGTVHVHVQSIFRKLGIRSRPELSALFRPLL